MKLIITKYQKNYIIN